VLHYSSLAGAHVPLYVRAKRHGDEQRGAVAATTLSLASAGVSAVILLFYWWAARHEERILSEKCGEEYRRYRARVGMFFPRPPSGSRAGVAGPQKRGAQSDSSIGPRQTHQRVELSLGALTPRPLRTWALSAETASWPSGTGCRRR